jgi:hypothetical protein
MAIEFNVTASHKFFLGEDKVIDFVIFGPDGVTPLNVSGMPMQWSLRKTDNAGDPAIIVKNTGAATGVTIVGTYNAVPTVNTQRVRVTFASADTDPVITGGLATPYTLRAGVVYRHSLKRTDVGNEGILSYGSFTFLQATER